MAGGVERLGRAGFPGFSGCHGQNEIFTGPDGRLWLSCHGTLEGDGSAPMLFIDPIWFDADGTVRLHGPTFTPQEVSPRG